MFLFEVLIYVFFAYVMYSYAKKSYAYTVKTGKTDYPDKNLWMFWLFFALICGIRWNVGVDSVGYMMDFDRGNIRDDSNEYLWDLLVLSVHKLYLPYIIGMGITAFVQIYFTTKLLTPYRFVLLFLPVALFGGEYFLSYCNAVRQMMAASIFVYSTHFIIKKKLIPYLFCIICASLIHHSAILLLLLYMITYIPIKISIPDKRLLCIVFLLFCFVVGLNPQFQNYARFFSTLVDVYGDNYTQLHAYIEEKVVAGENNARNFGPLMLSFFLSALAIVWYGGNMRRKYQKVLPYYDLWWGFAYIYVCGFFLFGNIGFMFLRPLMYFLPFQLIITSLLLFYFYSSKLKNHFWGYIGIIWLGLVWDIMKNIGNPIESVTYKLFMFHNFDEWNKLIQQVI